MDLEAFRADPLRFFSERDDNTLSDELKEIVARGIVTKKELKDKLLPYITGYKTRMNTQFDEFLPSEAFINAHVASTRFDEDAAALLNKVEAEMKWLYDAVDVFDKERAAAAGSYDAFGNIILMDDPFAESSSSEESSDDSSDDDEAEE